MDRKAKTIECLGYPLFKDSLNFLPESDKLLVSTINQYSYCVAEEDDEFKKALLGSDVILPDGIGMVLASKFLKGKKIKKIAGADFHLYQLNRLNKIGGSCFYLGSSKETLEKIKERLAKEFPNLKTSSYSPPFKSNFSLEDNEKMISAVNEFKPNVLFVGMTAPKQEKWSFENHKRINANVICSIGAVFDFYAGTIDRPGKIWRSLGLEWLGRLIKEPKRLWKRYIFYGIIFLKTILLEKFKKVKA